MLKNILIIDIPNRDTLNLVYRIHNNATICCSNGETALSVCRRWKPDLIICGEMKDMHPWDFAKALLPHVKLRPLMVAIFTYHENAKYSQYRIAESLEHGFDVAVECPLLLSTLLAWARKAHLSKIPHEFLD